MDPSLRAFAEVDLPRLQDPALADLPRDVVLSAAALELVGRLERLEDGAPDGVSVLDGLPDGLRTGASADALWGHLEGRLHPSGPARAGDLAGVLLDVRRTFEELPDVLSDDLGGLCDGSPVRTARWRVLRALLEAEAELAEDPAGLALEARLRDPWRWVDPAFLPTCAAP